MTETVRDPALRAHSAPVSFEHSPQSMRLRQPFRIHGYQFDAMPAVRVTLSAHGVNGRGEGGGVYYLGDDVAHMVAALERARDAVEAGADRADLQRLLPPGGARNALDCAMWEMESLRRHLPVWQLAGGARPRPLLTTFTVPAVDPAQVADRVACFPSPRAIKIKLDGDLAADAARVETVRRMLPGVWIGVDANQGYQAATLDALTTMLVANGVALLEQPVPRGQEAALDGWRSPIPLAADESVQDLAELDEQRHRFAVINIKLDKCGGLTESLRMADLAARLGLGVMVGNMGGSTLAMAPAFILGQRCQVVDLDGPWFLADDPLATGLYSDGLINIAPALWGAA